MGKDTIVIRRDVSPRNYNHRKKRRKKNMTLTYLVMFVFIALCCLILSMTVLFNTTTIRVNGAQHYTNEQVLAIADIKVGDNLVRLNTERARKNVEKTLVYVDECKITKKFPSTVVIDITEAKEAANVMVLNNYCVISEGGKILDNRLTSPKPDLPVVVGLDCTDDTLSTHITSADINKVGILLELLSLLEPTKLAYVTQIDMTDRTDMKLLYDDRIEIQIGSSYDLEYKLGYVRQIITDKLATNWEGTIIYYSATAGASAIKKGDELVTPIKPEDMSGDDENSSEDENSEND